MTKTKTKNSDSAANNRAASWTMLDELQAQLQREFETAMAEIRREHIRWWVEALGQSVENGSPSLTPSLKSTDDEKATGKDLRR